MNKKVLTSSFFMIFFFLFFINISSADWVIPKQKTCEFMNVTDSACDMLWCNIIDCDYDSSLEACICINNSYEEINSSLYYNKTEINSLFDFYNKSIEGIKENITNLNESFKDIKINNTNELINKTYLEDELKIWKANIEGDKIKKDSFSNDFDPIWIFVILGIVGIGIFLLNRQKEQTRKNKGSKSPSNEEDIVMQKAMELITNKNKIEKNPKQIDDYEKSQQTLREIKELQRQKEELEKEMGLK